MKYDGLIIGLGNPGRKYARHRHNIGFMAVDHLKEQATRERKASIGSLPSFRIPARIWSWEPAPGASQWVLAQPTTFMNRSGRAAAAISRRYALNPERILVVHDELDLPPGRLRFKQGGGLAGHNGLKSVAESLGSKGFNRLRLGIGRPESSDLVVDYVLSPFRPEERDQVLEMLDLAAAGLRCYVLEGIEQAMNELHQNKF